MTSPPIPIHCSAAMPLPPMSCGIGPVIAEVEMNTGTDQDATIVQACSMFYDTPAMLDKAEKLIAEAAGYGSLLALFPEVFVGGYPHGSTSGLIIGCQSSKGKEDFQKYHASAIDVPEHTAVCPGGSSIISPSGAVLAGSSQLTWTLERLFSQSLIPTPETLHTG